MAHNSMSGGHLGVKKTEDRNQTNFFWPRVHNDVTRFWRSCDIWRKTASRESAPQASLEDMQLIDQPFKRVAIDLLGSIAPASDKGSRYILTLVDYATKYQEAVPMQNGNTETMAEALLYVHSRVGFMIQTRCWVILGCNIHRIAQRKCSGCCLLGGWRRLRITLLAMD